MLRKVSEFLALYHESDSIISGKHIVLIRGKKKGFRHSVLKNQPDELDNDLGDSPKRNAPQAR